MRFKQKFKVFSSGPSLSISHLSCMGHQVHLKCFRRLNPWVSTWKNLQRDGNIRPPDWLLRNLYAGQEATVRSGHGTTDWFQIGKGIRQGWYCHSAYLTYMQSILWNARLNEAQAGIKIARININNLRYADDTTLMAESEEKLKSLFMKVKESEKSWL